MISQGLLQLDFLQFYEHVSLSHRLNEAWRHWDIMPDFLYEIFNLSLPLQNQDNAY